MLAFRRAAISGNRAALAGAVAGGGGGTNTFDPTRNTGQTLSNGNLTATESSPGCVAGTKAVSSGTHTFTWQPNGSGGSPNVGIVDATFDTTTNLGGNTHSVGYTGGDGHLDYNNADIAFLDTCSRDNPVAVKVDCDAKTISLNINNAGFGAPVSISSMTFPVYVAVQQFVSGSGGTIDLTSW